ncbi:MAG: sigma 54-interacting transcriptional regulator [Planctomycetota bacterium]
MPRILAVDDCPDQLLSIELLLQGEGFDIETAGDGWRALELCKDQEYDLILLDVRMPDLDGFEVSRRLAGDHRSATTPILFLTGHLPSEHVREEACSRGAVDFVQKPFERDHLLARIRLMLRLQEVRRRLAVENARLGRELDAATRALGESQAREADLRQLCALGEAADRGTVLVAADGVVRGVDARAKELLPALRPGARLDEQGEAGARLAELLARRGGGADVVVRGRGIVRCDAVDLGGAMLVLQLRDAATGAVVRERMRAREQFRDEESDPAGAAGDDHYRITDFVGRSPSVRAVEQMVDKLRRGRTTVLIHGETGTGKELVARALHFDGPNPRAPFIPMHCGAISRDLVESELFGFEKGAFTGAQQSHEGLFGAADGGTIFLDEIAETSLELQVKLLRVLQMGEVRPVGSARHRIVDVRVVAATNRDLGQLVREGRFREDLYHRLGVVTLRLPPLRERIADLPLLIDFFLRRGNERHQRASRPVRGVSVAAMQELLAYRWPGNVRELENVLERAFALGAGEVVQVDDLPAHVRSAALHRGDAAPLASPPRAAVQVLDLQEHRRSADRQAFELALAQAAGDKQAAARALGLPRSTFYRRLRELGL